MENKNVKSIIIIASGGLDSTTLIWKAMSEKIQIREILSFNYGQKHSREIENIKSILLYLRNNGHEIDHKIVDITTISDLISKGALTGEEDLPKEMYDKESQRITIVPNRNMILLSIAAGRGVVLDVSHVAYAAHASDYEVYPDCRPEFIKSLSSSLKLGNLWTPIELYAPFQNLSKTDLVTLGLELNVPFELTWSCYEGKERPCLECGTCLERTEAFYKNKVKDLALNDSEWEQALILYKKHSSSNR